MPHPCPHHCPKPGGGLAALAVLAAVILIGAIARPAIHAVEDLVLIAAIATAVVLGLAVIAATVYVALHARRSRARRITPVSFPAPVLRATAESISEPPRRAIEAPRLGLADLEALAAEHGYDIIRRDRGD